MEMEVTDRERNELLEREDIELSLTHDGEATPSENDVRGQLAAELDLDPTTICVDHVYTATGRGTSTAEVTVFDEPIMDEAPEDDSAEATEEEEAETEDATEEEEESEEADGDEADEEAEESPETDEAEDEESDEDDA